jgi:hypothetical protein
MRKLFIFLILIAPFGILFFNLPDFPFPARSDYSDLAISHFPNAVFLLHSINEWHQIPLWSNTILSGYPFAADPLSGIWYLPGWIAYLFPLPLGFNLNIILHLVWGGFGIFYILIKEQKSDLAAVAGALIFELFSKNFAHYAAGHLTLLYAVSWTPWIFISEKFYRKGKWYLLSGVILGLVALADIRWFAFLGMIWFLFAVYTRRIESDWKLLALISRTAASLGIAILVAAPLLLPLLEFTGLSTRAAMTPSESLMMSLPPSYLAGLAIPDMQGYAEWMLYPGGAALILTIFSLSVRELRKKNLFWIGTILFALVIAVGSATPIGSLLFHLPGFDLLRVPTRIIFLAGVSFAMIAADCIQFLLQSGQRKDVVLKPVGNGLAIAALAGFLILICAGLLVYTGTVPINYLWGTAAILTATGLVLARRSQRINSQVFLLVMIPMICLDLGGVDWIGLRFLGESKVLQESSAEISWLEAQNAGTVRVYSPSYSLAQQTAVVNHLELSDGVDPLQLKSYVDYMERATGIAESGYSVTLPPFSSANPEEDNAGKTPDAGYLGQLNIKYIVSAFNVSAPGLVFRANAGISKIYENSDFRPRAWVQADLASTSPVLRPSERLAWTPNRIEVAAKGEGWLILSEINYPGWSAFVDGNPTEIKTYNSILRAVHIPEGQHQIMFDFNPPSVYGGIVLAVLGWMVALVFFFFRGRIGRR